MKILEAATCLADLQALPSDRLESLHGNRITQIIQGKRAVTGDTALRLGHWFGMSAAFWMNLQTFYDLRVAEQDVGAAIAHLPRRDTAAPLRTE